MNNDQSPLLGRKKAATSPPKRPEYPDPECGFLVLGNQTLVGRDVNLKQYRSAAEHAKRNGMEVRFADVPTTDLMRPTRPSWKDRVREQMNNEEEQN